MTTRPSHRRRARAPNAAPGRRRWLLRAGIVAALVLLPAIALLVLPRWRSQRPPEIDEATRHALNEAEAHFNAGRFDRVVAVAEAQLAREPDAAGLHYIAGAALQELGDQRRAAENLRAEIAHVPGHFDSQLRLGRALTELGEIDEANRALRAALAIEPGNARASLQLGRNLARAGAADQAEPLLLEAARGGIAAGWYELGLLYRRRHDPAAAENAFRNALAIDPDHLEATFELGQTLLRAGKEEEGQRFLGRHAELEARLGKIDLLRHRVVEPGAGAGDLADLARYLLLQHDVDGAIATYRKALDRDPAHVAAQVGLGQALLEQGDAAAAAKTLEQAITRAPEDAEAHFFLGLARHLEGDYRGAQQALARSRQLRKWTGKEHLFLGNVLASTGALADAEQAYRSSLEASPEIPEAHYRLGLVLEQRDRAADARPELARFVELEPREPRGALLLGLAEHRAGDTVAADASFRRALDRLEVAVPDPRAQAAMLDEMRGLPGAAAAIERLEALRRERGTVTTTMPP